MNNSNCDINSRYDNINQNNNTMCKVAFQITSDSSISVSISEIYAVDLSSKERKKERKVEKKN